jgi:hypothetical protein
LIARLAVCLKAYEPVGLSPIFGMHEGSLIEITPCKE